MQLGSCRNGDDGGALHTIYELFFFLYKNAHISVIIVG